MVCFPVYVCAYIRGFLDNDVVALFAEKFGILESRTLSSA